MLDLVIPFGKHLPFEAIFCQSSIYQTGFPTLWNAFNCKQNLKMVCNIWTWHSSTQEQALQSPMSVPNIMALLTNIICRHMIHIPPLPKYPNLLGIDIIINYIYVIQFVQLIRFGWASRFPRIQVTKVMFFVIFFCLYTNNSKINEAS